jgi:hypothetical protein
LSTRLANHAAGIMPSPMMRKPIAPARQPNASARPCPNGAAIIAPSEPKAVTPPSTMLRTCTGTAREATEFASADAVHDIATPMQIPAPMMTAIRLCAVASRARPMT